MPTIAVRRDILFEKLGQSYSDEEFDEICFQFGIEVDDIVDESVNVDGVEKIVKVYKIEIGANRYDLLCMEGLSEALKHFLKKSKEIPKYNFVRSLEDFSVFVDEKLVNLRPYIGCAILKNFQMTQEAFNSLIDLQEKLHYNLCRRRTLVAIGVHDLDKVKLPLKYIAKKPTDIKFKPLTIDAELTAPEMFDEFKKTYLKEFLHIIEDKEYYPLIVDSTNTVLSLPPIINGSHTKVTLESKNLLIECTGVDESRTNIVLLMVAILMSYHCQTPYTIEMGQVIDSKKGLHHTPKFVERDEILSVDWLNKCIGIHCDQSQYIELLKRMSLPSCAVGSDKIKVNIPPNRPDIMHKCDLMEDAAIAYGYNNIEKVYPKVATISKEVYEKRYYDKLRNLISQCGYIEAMSFIVGKSDDFVNKMNNSSIDNEVVKIHSCTEYDSVRPALIPGILKTLSYNEALPLPLKIFEISDVVKKIDFELSAVGATNRRHLVAAYCGKTSGFEQIQGLFDKIMNYLSITFGKDSSKYFYYLLPQDDPSMFPTRNFKILINEQDVGYIGTVHPDVLHNYELTHPCTVFEIDIQKVIEITQQNI